MRGWPEITSEGGRRRRQAPALSRADWLVASQRQALLFEFLYPVPPSDGRGCRSPPLHVAQRITISSQPPSPDQRGCPPPHSHARTISIASPTATSRLKAVPEPSSVLALDMILPAPSVRVASVIVSP